MKVFRGSTCNADRARGAVDIASIGGVTTRLHLAHPLGEARILVVEREGSV